MKETTAKRLKNLLLERNLRQVDVLRLAEPYCKELDVKLNKSDLSQYLSGRVEPSQSKLVILGLALNVSEAWLLGMDVPMENQKFTDGTVDGILLKKFHTLTARQKALVLDMIDNFLDVDFLGIK